MKVKCALNLPMTGGNSKLAMIARPLVGFGNVLVHKLGASLPNAASHDHIAALANGARSNGHEDDVVGDIASTDLLAVG